MAKKADGVRVARKVKGGKDKVLKDDAFIEPSQRTSANTVGMSIGVTRDQGHYESLRIDAWKTQILQPGDDPDEIHLQIADDLKSVIEEVYDEFSWGGNTNEHGIGYTGRDASGARDRNGRSKR